MSGRRRARRGRGGRLTHGRPRAGLRPPGRAGRALTSALLVVAAACSAPHSALDPASEAASAIADLWWLLLAVCGGVFVVVLALCAYAVARRRPGEEEAPGARPGEASAARGREPAGDAGAPVRGSGDGAGTRPAGPEEDAESTGRGPVLAVVAGGAVTALILVGLTVVTILTSGRLQRASDMAGADTAGPEGATEPVDVHVIGHQFWWEVRYPGSGAVTANEVHLPAGRPARVRLTSGDVVHSFWVPRLHGKRDMTPGRVEELVLAPREPGVYRGFCSEFCGVQHALMGFLVVVEAPERFEAWVREQAEPAPRPDAEAARRGEQLFVAAQCALCHAVRGLEVEGPGDVGPDLTHLASRRTLGAGTVPNDAGALASWITDPHSLKPGVRMPATRLAPEDLDALVAYLGSLR